MANPITDPIIIKAIFHASKGKVDSLHGCLLYIINKEYESA